MSSLPLKARPFSIWRPDLKAPLFGLRLSVIRLEQLRGATASSKASGAWWVPASDASSCWATLGKGVSKGPAHAGGLQTVAESE